MVHCNDNLYSLLQFCLLEFESEGLLHLQSDLGLNKNDIGVGDELGSRAGNL